MGMEASLKLSITVTSGSGTGTVSSMWQLARWIRIIPVSETDSFDVSFKDADGNVMLSRSAQLGTYSEKVEMSLGILKTIAITQASADGTYTVKFDMH